MGVKAEMSETQPPESGEAKVAAPAVEAAPVKVFPGAVYECVRCGTRTTQEELSSLPEVKCICGYRVFRKVRPSVVKQIKAV